LVSDLLRLRRLRKFNPQPLIAIDNDEYMARRVGRIGARNARKIDSLPEPLMEELLAKIVTLFE
jgi:hypothetical protein